MIRSFLVMGLCAGAVCLTAAEKAPAPQGQAAAFPQSTQQYPTPVPMGTSCGNWVTNSGFIYAGTCGMKVQSLIVPGLKGILSNNHVLGAAGANLCPNQATPLSTITLHPGTLDIGTIPANPTPYAVGVVAGFVPLDFTLGASNLVDAAVAYTNDALTDTAIVGLGVPTPAAKWAAPGMVVTKTGRTTDTTVGTVDSVNTTVFVSYGLCGTARFVGQTVITPGAFSAGGDSGSVILEQSTNTPVGLLFAGSGTMTIANQINLVYYLLRFFVDSPDAGAASQFEEPLGETPRDDPDPRMAALRAVQASAEPLLFSNSDVRGVGIGLADDGVSPALVVYTRGEAARTARQLPRRHQGVPIRVVSGQEFNAYGWE